jgi:hypothetical protein
MNRVGVDGDLDFRGDPRLFRRVERVVAQLLGDDQRPGLDVVADLLDKFGDGGEFGEARGAEDLPR